MSKEAFIKELEQLINKHSMEGESNTPDFILADYLTNCLEVFTLAIKKREGLKKEDAEEKILVEEAEPNGGYCCSKCKYLETLLNKYPCNSCDDTWNKFEVNLNPNKNDGQPNGQPQTKI